MVRRRFIDQNWHSITICPPSSGSYSYSCQANYTFCNNTTASASDTVIVNAGGIIPVINASADTSVCYGSSTQLWANSSVSGSSFMWQPSSGLSNAFVANPLASPLTTTNYVLTVTDTFCSSVDTITISVDAPVLNLTLAQDASCFGFCDGQAILNTSGGIGPFTVTWTPGNMNGFSQSQLCASSYTVTLTDSLGCRDSVPVNIQQPPQLIVSVTNNAAICFGDTIQLSVLSADSTASFSWVPGYALSDSTLSNPVSNPATTTTYTVTASDGACSAIDSVTIFAGAPVLANLVQFQNVNCFGDCDGTATVSGSGGFAPYSYLWQPINTNGSAASQLCAGSYSITVTDSIGCQSIFTVIITEPAPFILSAGSSHDTIYAGDTDTLWAIASGGQQPYFYNWSWPSGSSSGDSIFVSPLSTTTYDIFAIDSLGCNAGPLQLTVVVDITTALTASDQDASYFIVYPNPSKDLLSIHTGPSQGKEENWIITFYDATGKLVLTNEIKTKSNLLQVDLHTLSPGVYLIMASDSEGKNFSRKISVQ